MIRTRRTLAWLVLAGGLVLAAAAPALAGEDDNHHPGVKPGGQCSAQDATAGTTAEVRTRHGVQTYRCEQRPGEDCPRWHWQYDGSVPPGQGGGKHSAGPCRPACPSSSPAPSGPGSSTASSRPPASSSSPPVGSASSSSTGPTSSGPGGSASGSPGPGPVLPTTSGPSGRRVVLLLVVAMGLIGLGFTGVVVGRRRRPAVA